MCYERDVKTLSELGLGSDAGFVAVCAMAILSIRQPFRTVKRQMLHVKSNGFASGYLWGHKAAGLAYVTEHASRLRTELLQVAVPGLRDETSAEQALEILTEVPMLGLAKAGFVAQMLGFDVGCIDSRNAGEFGLGRAASRFDKTDAEHVRLNRISRYVTLCRSLGGARFLWNNWCEGIARDEFFRTADFVSAYHVDCVRA